VLDADPPTSAAFGIVLQVRFDKPAILCAAFDSASSGLDFRKAFPTCQSGRIEHRTSDSVNAELTLEEYFRRNLRLLNTSEDRIAADVAPFGQVDRVSIIDRPRYGTLARLRFVEMASNEGRRKKASLH